MNRRAFLEWLGVSAAVTVLRPSLWAQASPRLALTFDDFNLSDAQAASRNAAILRALRSHDIQAGAFVIGRNVAADAAMSEVRHWGEAGHVVGNHTFSHRSYSRSGFEAFSQDVLAGELALQEVPGFRKWLRFPILDEGRTADLRDRMRTWLDEHSYRNAHVTIDDSDWYIADRLRTRLATDPAADVDPYRQYYLDHLWERAQYYDSLAQQLAGRSIAHVLLLHHNVTSGLFLDDAILMFRARGWSIVGIEEAYEDPIYTMRPASLPAGQSLSWALARASGGFDGMLRYPGEDGAYEKARMDALGL